MPGIVALQAGAVFAKDFRVVRKLSEGGMGAVYVVEQISTGRERALKLMHPELTQDASLRAKFVQEARIGARVKSDHVVEVVSAGIDEETGTPYLAMELLEGEDLDSRLERETPSTEEAYAILEQLCHAVAAAHASGIVHRDLKPENVFLRRARNAGGPSEFASTVKVLDFGIAKVVEEARTSNNTGALGSPFWMAPEQTERRATITPATDVWAIGLIAFNVFVGKPFWRSANDGASSLTAFMRELVLEPIPPASRRAAEIGAAERLPPHFDAWFAKCVAREPSERFQDAGHAWQALAHAAGRRSFTLPTAEAAPQAPRVHTGDLALARTLPHTGDTAIDDDEPQHVPVSSAKWPFALGAVVLLGGGGVFFAMHASTSSPTDPPAPTASAKATDLICPDGMAAIAGGKLSMGDSDGESDERPVHDVQLNAFCIDLSEVTVAQYDACAKAGACPAASKSAETGAQPRDRAVWDAFCNEGKADRQNHPMNCVSWEEARAFCKHEDKRLPSEEEWEYAARGSEGRVFPWGGDSPSATLLDACGAECAVKGKLLGLELAALYPAEDGWPGTAPVRSFPAGRTPNGVFDMAGNVSEWTSSAFCPYPGTNCTSEMRATRGSAWSTDELRHVRATTRQKTAPSARSADLGFRCAK